MRPILIVEDNADDVFFARRAFKNAGIVNPLVVLEDGDAAISYLQKSDGESDEGKALPGLIFLDLKLPLKSGIDVLHWIRSQESPLGSLVTVAMVSSPDSPDINSTKQAGANSFLVKPPTAEKLLKLRQNLGLSFLEVVPKVPQAQQH